MDDKHCLLWSIIAHLHPCENTNPKRVSNYTQGFVRLVIESFDFSNGRKRCEMYRFEKLKGLSTNFYEINF